MTTELDWWERKHRQRHEDEPKQRAVMYRCLVCRTDTFSPTGIGVKCAKCNDWTRMEVTWCQP